MEEISKKIPCPIFQWDSQDGGLLYIPPPYVSFRFVADESGVVDKLQAAIDSYKGKVKWVMVAHQREGLPGINWMICPRRIQEASSLAKNFDMTAGQYLAETEPEFGPIAYDDFAKLEEYLRYELGGVRRQG